MLDELGDLPAPANCTRELSQAWPNLNWARQAALSAVWRMESEPLLNAGIGSSFQADGRVRVSASFMESQGQIFSAVINANGLLHPCELAWWLQGQRHTVVDATGAELWMSHLNILPQTLETTSRLKRWVEYKKRSLRDETSAGGRTGTVGAVALAMHGTLAAVTSTGGVGNEVPGRVGDSPTIAGNYCSERVAVSCTGIGEQIINFALSPRIAFGVEKGQTLKQAMLETFEGADQKGFEFAAIALAFHPQDQSLEWAAASCGCHLLWQLRPSE